MDLIFITFQAVEAVGTYSIMQDLSLHILDLTENSITAGADRIKIKIVEDIKANLFLLEISDNGRGMDKEMFEHACDPFYTTRTTRKVGLGSRCWHSLQEIVMEI